MNAAAEPHGSPSVPPAPVEESVVGEEDPDAGLDAPAPADGADLAPLPRDLTPMPPPPVRKDHDHVD